jgi:tetratricopeptide (TPR) repeat protein
MKKAAYWGGMVCVATVAFAAGWLMGKGQRVRMARDGDGLVLVEGGSLPFPAEYRAAAAFVLEGKIPEAKRLYHELTQRDPNSPEPYVGLGNCRAKTGDVTGARALFQEALQKDPKSVLGLVGLGSTYVLQSDYTNAAINYERALALNEASAEAHWGLTIAYAYLGESGRARGNLDRFKQLNPGSPRVVELERLVGSATSQPTAAPNAASPHR